MGVEIATGTSMSDAMITITPAGDANSERPHAVGSSVVHAFAGDVVGGLEELLTPPPLTEAEGGGAA